VAVGGEAPVPIDARPNATMPMTQNPRVSKVHSATNAERMTSFGWSLRTEFREHPSAEPYEYLLEWRHDDEPLPLAVPSDWLGIRGTALGGAFHRELQNELSVGHPCFGRAFEPLLAKGDDVVFLDPLGGYVLVHLTWRAAPETPPWPDTQGLPTSEALLTALQGDREPA